jgi:hypothetical protein
LQIQFSLIDVMLMSLLLKGKGKRGEKGRKGGGARGKGGRGAEGGEKERVRWVLGEG